MPFGGGIGYSASVDFSSDLALEEDEETVEAEVEEEGKEDERKALR